jgi:hypothetical protein
VFCSNDLPTDRQLHAVADEPATLPQLFRGVRSDELPAGDPYPSMLLEFAQLRGHRDPEYAVAETLDYFADKTTTTVRDVNARIITDIFDASYADPDTGDGELIRKLCMMARAVEKRGARIRAVEELHAPDGHSRVGGNRGVPGVLRGQAVRGVPLPDPERAVRQAEAAVVPLRVLSARPADDPTRTLLAASAAAPSSGLACTDPRI